ncbi:uncharacterized protein UV8b_03245 [Ustilaginoidea virens]|uniref:Uncharacterized protein n=1 Tax=Ustilaginoidea virens TaxID=1159556 RepID=A0A8E5HQ15_USTVR|nr:uncharacterized protein UV8b_03245 [Ustilaginoidea virens]QUC19004.1 hypothetical protein UV8b_03245 [Ustilaginoidea virens]
MLLESFIVDVVLLTETEGIDKQASNLPTEQANRGGATHNQDRQKRPGQSHTSLAGTRSNLSAWPRTDPLATATVKNEAETRTRRARFRRRNHQAKINDKIKFQQSRDAMTMSTPLTLQPAKPSEPRRC